MSDFSQPYRVMLLISLAVLDIETYAASISRNDHPAVFNSRIPLSRILRAAFKSRSLSIPSVTRGAAPLANR